jgi:hypothetical protein
MEKKLWIRVQNFTDPAIAIFLKKFSKEPTFSKYAD